MVTVGDWVFRIRVLGSGFCPSNLFFDVWQVLEGLWQVRGMSVAGPWQVRGRSVAGGVAGPWQVCGRSVAGLWQVRGR